MYIIGNEATSNNIILEANEGFTTKNHLAKFDKNKYNQDYIEAYSLPRKRLKFVKYDTGVIYTSDNINLADFKIGGEFPRFQEQLNGNSIEIGMNGQPPIGEIQNIYTVLYNLFLGAYNKVYMKDYETLKKMGLLVVNKYPSLWYVPADLICSLDKRKAIKEIMNKYPHHEFCSLNFDNRVLITEKIEEDFKYHIESVNKVTRKLEI